jgi:hypothetical protein
MWIKGSLDISIGPRAVEEISATLKKSPFWSPSCICSIHVWYLRWGALTSGDVILPTHCHVLVLCCIWLFLPSSVSLPPSKANHSVSILYVISGQSLWIVLTWFDKLLYPVWISLMFSVHTLYSWIRRWRDFHLHSTVLRTATQHTWKNLRRRITVSNLRVSVRMIQL